MSKKKIIIIKKKKETSQYEYKCDSCKIVLGINVPIMCYMNKDLGDETVCNECYYDSKMWKTDENEDNEDEIAQAKEEELEEVKEDFNKSHEALDNILYEDGLQWDYEKPKTGAYETIYIFKNDES